jgi:hypothetical protein
MASYSWMRKIPETVRAGFFSVPSRAARARWSFATPPEKRGLQSSQAFLRRLEKELFIFEVFETHGAG